MGKLEISKWLIWAVTHKNPSNSFYAITAENEKSKHVTARQQTFDGHTDRPTCSKLV